MAAAGFPSDDSSIQDCPDEILEYILSLTSPYRDFKSAMMVCKRWHKVMQSVSIREHANFVRAIEDHALEWHLLPPEDGPTITERYSHSVCYHNQSMYIFGGCTFSSTTFNDLWRFDLATREWVRPLATGTYPSPKACASLVSVGGELYLFGGWSHPTPYTFHQASKFFNQLHSYNPSTNKWTEIFTESGPVGKAGHGASVVGHTIVLFGGYHGHGTSSNEIWVFNTLESSWDRKEIHGTRPLPRYGHTQIKLDDRHILVVGGCGGPNMLFNDVWILDISGAVWSWHEIQVLQPSNSPQQLWCHSACLVDDKVVFLCKTNKPPKSPPSSGKAPLPRTLRPWASPRQEEGGGQSGRFHSKFKRSHPETSESSSQESSSDQEDAAVGRVSLNSAFSRPRGHSPRPGTSRGAPNPVAVSSGIPGAPRSGLPSVRPNAMKNRQKQLETLRRYEAKIKEQMKPSTSQNTQGAASNDVYHPHRAQNPMYLHVLDVSSTLEQKTVTWMPLADNPLQNAPEETIFYSLVHGRGELILFGGIQTDLNSMQRGLTFSGNSQVVKNSVHFLKGIRSLS